MPSSLPTHKGEFKNNIVSYTLVAVDFKKKEEEKRELSSQSKAESIG